MQRIVNDGNYIWSAEIVRTTTRRGRERWHAEFSADTGSGLGVEFEYGVPTTRKYRSAAGAEAAAHRWLDRRERKAPSPDRYPLPVDDDPVHLSV